MQHLQKLENSPKRNSQELAIQTVPDLGELAVQTESQLATALMGRRTTESQTLTYDGKLQDVCSDVRKMVRENQMSVQGQRKVLIEHELLSKHSIKQREKELHAKMRQIEEMFLASSERLELERQRLEEKADVYRKQDASTLEIITHHQQNVEKIEHKETQLELYIEEKQREIEEDTNDSVSSSLTKQKVSSPGGSELWLFSKSSHTQSTPSMMDSSFISERSFPHGGARPKSGSGSSSANRNKTTSKRAQDITDRLYPGPPKRGSDDKQTPRAAASVMMKKKGQTSSSTLPHSTLKGQGGKRIKGNVTHTNVLSVSNQADIPMTIEESPEMDTIKDTWNFIDTEDDGTFEVCSPTDSAFESPNDAGEISFPKKPKPETDTSFDTVTGVMGMDSISSAETLIPVDSRSPSGDLDPLYFDATFRVNSKPVKQGTTKIKKSKQSPDVTDVHQKVISSTEKKKHQAAKEVQLKGVHSCYELGVETTEKEVKSECQESIKSDDFEMVTSFEREAQPRSSSEPPKMSRAELDISCQQSRSRSVSHTSHTISSKAKAESQNSSRRSSLSSVKSEKSSSGTEKMATNYKQTKGGAKRTRKGKDLTRSSDAYLSKPKKSKRGDFHLEIYIPSGSVGGGGGTSLPIGSGSASGDDPFRSNTDPTHDVFARSLRSSSFGSDRSQGSTTGSVHEEICGFLDSGTKVIRRQRAPPSEQEIEDILKKQNRTAQIFIPHKLQDGRTQSIDLMEESDISEASSQITSSELHSDSKTVSISKVFSDDSLAECEAAKSSHPMGDKQLPAETRFSDDSLEDVSESDLNQVTRSTSDISTKTVIEREPNNGTSFRRREVDDENRKTTVSQQQDLFDDQLRLMLPNDEKRFE